MREAKELSEATSDYYAQPLSDNLFEWHFTVSVNIKYEFSCMQIHNITYIQVDADHSN